MINKHPGFTFVLLTFMLMSCNSSSIDLKNDFRINFNETVGAYRLYYKSEGILNEDIAAYYENGSYILTKNETSSAIQYIHKTEFTKAYGSGNWGVGMKTFKTETEVKQFLKMTKEINWNEIN